MGPCGRQSFIRAAIFGLALTALLSGCSIKRLAVNRLGSALAAGGATFASDDDPDLIREAAPFSLKTMEILLVEAPRHTELRRAAAAGFTQYAYAFVQTEADEKESSDFSASENLRARARRLFLRARAHGLRGLEVLHPGFEQQLRTNTTAAVASLCRKDVPLVYWTGVAWASAIGQSKDRPELIGELPLVSALMERALVLDPEWNHGTLQTFFISFATTQPDLMQSSPKRAREHFEQSLALSKGAQAGPYVALAESVSLPAGRRVEFERLLNQALLIDPEKHLDWRLENLIFQRRARWLLSRLDELFVLPPLERLNSP